MKKHKEISILREEVEEIKRLFFIKEGALELTKNLANDNSSVGDLLLEELGRKIVEFNEYGNRLVNKYGIEDQNPISWHVDFQKGTILINY